MPTPSTPGERTLTPRGGRIPVRVAPEARLDGLLHEQVAKRALLAPDAPALSFQGRVVSYQELDRRAEGLAAHLQERGAGPGVLVGLSVERSPEMVVGLLAILKAGGAYLPLDPDYPAARRDLILDDAKPRLVVTQTWLAGAFHARGIPTVDVTGERAGHRLRPGAGARDLAYVIYTSGSTGRPKGVLLEHEGLRQRMGVQRNAFRLQPGDRVLQFASLNFDASIFEIALALGAGATLCLAPAPDLLPGATLAAFLRRERVTATLLPPSVLAATPEADLPRLRLLLSGGEACHARLVDRWAPGRRFLNLYGPTEATIWATADECVAGAAPTLGRAVDGATVLVLDAEGRPVAPGERGELCIGGAGLARGYLGRDDLTARAFVEGPGGARVYRTGDLGVLLPDGRLQYLGRLDRQVKVRGFRVEPAEVEAALLAHPEVRDAVVEPETDAGGETRLVAYVLGAAPLDAPRAARDDERRAFRHFLSERLPDPMVPAAFLLLDRVPLTPNGKVDRAALPRLAAGAPAPDAAPASRPRNELERALAEAWAEALEVPAIGVHERFFDLGAHSLLLARVQARLAQRLGREVPALAFFEHPTVAALAAHLSAPAEAAEARGPGRGEARRAAARTRATRVRTGAPEEDEP